MTLDIAHHARIADIAAQDWNACANASRHGAYNPFTSYAFLHALEASGSAIPETGWGACHLTARQNDQIIGVMPLYIKAHSQGEYVFDQGWADAFERAGGRYYPKLLSAIPFSPVQGSRRLISDAAPPESVKETTDALLAYAIKLAQAHNLSSLHLNFISDAEASALESAGLLLRTDQQFHWRNQNYQDFDAFLKHLTSRKRKNLKKERAVAQENLTIEWLRGDAISAAHWDAFFEFYIDTGSRKWGMPYLTRDFFTRIANAMRDDILLIMARDDTRYIAGALNFIGGDTLYGRYWGTLASRDFLHFEICYYQAIEFAIVHKLGWVEAGAQGPHKLARGYQPMRTHSAHYIAHEGLRAAISDYLADERDYVEQDIAILRKHVPFRQEIK